jgi:hypothetical protein
VEQVSQAQAESGKEKREKEEEDAAPHMTILSGSGLDAQNAASTLLR